MQINTCIWDPFIDRIDNFKGDVYLLICFDWEVVYIVGLVYNINYIIAHLSVIFDVLLAKGSYVALMGLCIYPNIFRDCEIIDFGCEIAAFL